VKRRDRLEVAAEAILREKASEIAAAIRESVATALAPPKRGRKGDGLVPLRVAIARVEREHIERALEANGRSVIRAARALGIPVTTLKYKLQKHRMGRL
jgi:DNA-binding NtrC family response regulator